MMLIMDMIIMFVVDADDDGTDRFVGESNCFYINKM